MLSDLRFRLRALFRRRRVEADLDAELRAHLEAQIDKHVRAGLSRPDAVRRARWEFGGLDQIKDACRDARGVGWLETLASDLRYAARGLRKDRLVAGVTILTLALGVGATTTVFSVVNGILIEPLPYPESSRIVFPWRLAPKGVDVGAPEIPWGRADFLRYSAESRTFESLGAFLGGFFNVSGTGDPIRVDGARVSAGFFASLGTTPALGRVFTSGEDRPGHDREVILSDALWRDRFGGDSGIVGRTIDLDAVPYTVIGVMPPAFGFPRQAEMPASFSLPRQTRLWVPLALSTGPLVRGEPSELAVVGRLRPGASADQAQAELDVFAAEMERQYPTAKGWFNSRVKPLTQQIVGDTRRPLLLLLAAIGVVLLIVCANVANLLLTRSLARAREFALRAALGASRLRLARQLLTESLALSVVGGAAGALLAWAGVAMVHVWAPADLPRLADVRVNGLVLGFALGVSLLTGLLFGFAPAALASRHSAAQALKEGSARSSARSSRLRDALLVAEVALALVLVIASGLLVRTFVRITGVDGGFNADHVLTFELTLPSAKYADVDRQIHLYEGVLQQLAAVPGVRAAGLGETLPMGGAGESTALRLPHRPAGSDKERPYANYTIVSPGYFSAVGTPILKGRSFAASDSAQAQPVTIVNQTAARKFWPGEEAVGQHVGVPIMPFDMTVVGVVADAKHLSLREEPPPEVYVPFTQKVWPSMQTMHLAARVTGDAGAMTASVREAVRTVDADLPLGNVAALAAFVDASVAQPRFAMLLLAAFGALALALACVGLYGAASYGVSQRTREIGVRMALGASPARVAGLVLGRGLRLTAAGIGIGLASAMLVTQTMRRFLFGVTPTDATTFAAVSLLLVAVGLLACYLPARRAVRVDPSTTLRTD